jgi:hypothetical protein
MVERSSGSTAPTVVPGRFSLDDRPAVHVMSSNSVEIVEK